MVSNFGRKLDVCFFMLVFSALNLFASSDRHSMKLTENDWNVKLLDLKIGTIVDDYPKSTTYESHVLASSWLAPEGEPPVMKKDELYFGIREAEWTAMYGPSKVFDGKLDTAWSEGVEGDGIGEVIIVPLSPAEKLRIFAGFAKSKDLWSKNNRPRNIKIFILAATERLPGSIEPFPINMKVIDEQYATLKDVFDWQPLPIEQSEIEKFTENHKKKKPEVSDTDFNYFNIEFYFGVQILSVYPGSKYHDTLISEIDYVDESLSRKWHERLFDYNYKEE